MNNLEMKSFGVQELDAEEMTNVDGGNGILLFFVGAWLVDSLYNYNSTVENFKKGYNSVI